MKLENYSDYEIDIENGTIYSYRSNSTIGHLNNDGYMCTTLYDDNGKRSTIRHHRIIWEVTNGKIPNGYDIHHIDENRSNNTITNLEMIESSTHKRNHFTGSNNPNYGKPNPKRSELNKTKIKSVGCYSLQGELIKIYPSAKATSEDGFCPPNVTHCCKGDYSTYKGYIWKYMG